MTARIHSKANLRHMAFDEMQSIDDFRTTQIEIRGAENDKNSSRIYLSDATDESKAIEVEANPSQMSHFFYFSEGRDKIPGNFYRTPYDHFVDLVEFFGGEIKEIVIFKRIYDILWGAVVVSIGKEIVGISMPAADAIIYALVKQKPVKIVNKILSEERDD